MSTCIEGLFSQSTELKGLSISMSFCSGGREVLYGLADLPDFSFDLVQHSLQAVSVPSKA